MRLNTLKPAKGSKPVGKRLGRGISAGQGKTSGRGVKGQHARSGGYHKVGFEGGQMPLQRRLPKFGFKNRFRVAYDPVNLSRRGRLVEDGVLEDIREGDKIECFEVEMIARSLD